LPDLSDRLAVNLNKAAQVSALSGPSTRAQAREIVKAITELTLDEERADIGKATSLDDFGNEVRPGTTVYWQGAEAGKAAGGYVPEQPDPAQTGAFDTMGQVGGARFMTKGSQIFTESGALIIDTAEADRREARDADWDAVTKAAESRHRDDIELFNGQPALSHREASEAVYDLTTTESTIQGAE
jgi:hypothetical protein